MAEAQRNAHFPQPAALLLVGQTSAEQLPSSEAPVKEVVFAVFNSKFA